MQGENMSNSSTALVQMGLHKSQSGPVQPSLTDLLGGACCRFGKILWLMIHLRIDVGLVEYSRAAWRVLLSPAEPMPASPLCYVATIPKTSHQLVFVVGSLWLLLVHSARTPAPVRGHSENPHPQRTNEPPLC